MDLKQRMEQLKKVQEKLPEVLSNIAKNATMAAVEKATDLTPPTADDLAGTGTRTGELKAHWATDSKITPEISGGDYRTILANSMQYASYVNNGHRMAKHYVPGLMVNPYTGQLEKVDPNMGGIVVGTKTSYVEGLYMSDVAKKVYEEQVKQESKKLEELLK